MLVIGQPLYFEDKTGSYTNTSFDDIYDRMFFRVVQQAQTGRVLIYDKGRRSRRNSGPETMPPTVVLDFGGKSNALGTVTFERSPPIPMKNFIQKIGTWGSSLNRKFVASDSNEYRWTKKLVPGQEWTCVNALNQVIAHYDLKHPHEPAFGSSGNAFVVEEPLLPISAEILATLIIMRHIEKHRI